MPAGSYTITARAIATNPGQAKQDPSTPNMPTWTGVSAPVTFRVNAPPTVTMTAPANNAVFNAPASITLTASAADADGSVARVDFYQGTSLIGGASAAPFSINWTTVAAGSYSVTAVATDNLGASTTSAAITVIVNALPTVTLTGPANNASYTAPATITLTASASDADGTISKVEFLQGTTVLATLTAAPYTFTWTNVAQGTYVLSARATDNRGAATTSAAVTVNVNSGVAALYFIYPDHLGTPRLIADSTGTTVWRWDNQEPFGNDSPNADPNSTGTTFEFPLRFPGQYADRETNLYYNYHRDLDPSIGRYLQSDPIGIEGGLNTYLYVDAEPVLVSDVSGLQAARCRRTLGSLPGGQLNGRATQHWYSCRYVGQGRWICGGQTASGSIAGSAGMPTTPETDYYVESACTPVRNGTSCFENCLQEQWDQSRPYYSVFPFVGTQCQQYDEDVNARCRAQCGLR